MDKINFKNLPDTTIPLSADILMQLQDNIDNAKLENTHKTITDWNTAVETTLVATGPGILNGPDGVDYAGGLVLKRGTHILQVAIASRTGVLYTRASLNGTDWEEWVDYPNTLNGKLEKYTGSLDDINRTCNLGGAPATGLPPGAGNGWGYISTLKYSDAELFQLYFDKATGTIFYRFKKNGTWGVWNNTIGLILATTNADFNTLTDNKTYYFGSAPTGANKPINKSGVLEIFTTNTSLITQRYTTYDGQNMYTRGSYQGKWSNWKAW